MLEQGRGLRWTWDPDPLWWSRQRVRVRNEPSYTEWSVYTVQASVDDTKELTQRSQPGVLPLLVVGLNLTPHRKDSLSDTGVLGFHLNHGLRSFPLQLCARRHRHQHDRAPTHLLTMVIWTLLFMVKTSGTNWHDRATLHTSASRRIRCNTGCMCRVRRVPASDSTHCALRLRITPVHFQLLCQMSGGHCCPMESTPRHFAEKDKGRTPSRFPSLLSFG